MIFLEEEKKKEKVEEDILTKLSMPGKPTRVVAKEEASSPLRLGVVKEEVKEGQAEDLLSKLSNPKANVGEPSPKSSPSQTGLAIDVDRDVVKKLAENIFNSDFNELSQKKKKV